MFSFPSKRLREQDPIEFDSNASHERKKHRPLALHTTPNRYCQNLSPFDSPRDFSDLILPILTPVESSDDDDGDRKRKQDDLEASKPQQNDTLEAAASPMDIDLSRETQPSDSLYPWTASGQDDKDLQQSPISRNLINYSLSLGERNPRIALHAPIPENQHPRSPVDHSTYGQHAAYEHSQRLPSPVSEGEDILTNPSNAPRCNADLLPIGDTTLNMGSSPANSLGRDHGCGPKSNLGLNKKKKVAFAMGFRADCEKCRHKVPGHYSHIIRT